MNGAKRIFLALAALGVLVVLVGAAPAPPDQARVKDAKLMFEPLPPPPPLQGPVAIARVELGKKLYLDTRLSARGNVSCNSCHNLATAGVDNKPFSPGDEGKLGGRNSPTVYNAALHVAQFWDGRAADVEQQAGMPILNPVEMAMPSPDVLIGRLAKDPAYQKLFAAAFPGEKPQITYKNLGIAIGAFERRLITPSRFDAFLKGDDKALSAQEKAGLVAFVETGCTTCHDGATVGARSFMKFGMMEPYWQQTKSAKIDNGRFDQTKAEGDKYVFKVASLRNVARTGPYFHDGSIASLPEAVRVMAKVQLGQELTPQQTGDIVAFLGSLSGTPPAEASLPKEGKPAAP